MSDVVIYSKATCPYCDRAKMLLKNKGVEFKELRIDQDPKLLAEMLERSNNRRTVPQIFIGDHHVGGFDDLYALSQSGKLDGLLTGDSE